jgi:hypothetical protein
MADERKANPSLAFSDSDPLPFTSPKVHHHISESKRFKHSISEWLGLNAEDPAIKVSAILFCSQYPVLMPQLCRTFFPDCKVIFCLVYLIGPTLEMKRSLQTKSYGLSASVGISCTVTRLFESTTPRTTFEEHRTRSILARMLTSWCWLMKMMGQIRSLIGSDA